MIQEITLETIKEELYRMEERIIRERKERKHKGGSTFSYRLYEIRVDKNREDEAVMTQEERINAYKQRFEDIVNQHQINIEDNLDKQLCLVAIGEIHNSRKWQHELDNLQL